MIALCEDFWLAIPSGLSAHHNIDHPVLIYEKKLLIFSKFEKLILL